MAAGPPDPDSYQNRRDKFWQGRRNSWHDELCAEHDGRIRSFEGLTLKLREIEDYELVFTRKHYNLLRVGKIGVGVVAGTALLTPLAVVAGPHIAASLGAAGLLGAATTGTTISTLSGAALGSASLAAIGGGTMAGGIFVMTAAGVSLGGTMGGVISNAYLKEVEDFSIRKYNEGRGVSIILIDGFLTQDLDDPREWKRNLRASHRVHSWYHVNWESKTRSKLGRALCRDSTGQAARAFGVKLAQRAAVKAGLKINPATWMMAAASLLQNPFHVAMVKAAMTGALLADVLSRTQRKQFTLIGHSLGARVIYYTLLALGTRPSKPIIKNVYLLGGALGIGCKSDWDKAVKAVSGEIYNCYSTNDQVLKCLYRGAAGVFSKPIGAYPIQSLNPNIIDWDFSNLVLSHTAWKGNLAEVLARIEKIRSGR